MVLRPEAVLWISPAKISPNLPPGYFLNPATCEMIEQQLCNNYRVSAERLGLAAHSAPD
jgi:hypothetical protein